MQLIDFLLDKETIVERRNISLRYTLMYLVEVPSHTYAHIVVELLIAVLNTISIQEPVLSEINGIESEILSLESGFLATIR